MFYIYTMSDTEEIVVAEEPVVKPKRKTRTMTPEMLEKLAIARKKALEVKKKLKEEGDEGKVKFHQEKVMKKEANKKKKKDDIIRKEEILDTSGTAVDASNNDKEKDVDVVLEPNSEKSSPKIVYESESDPEDQIIYIKKSKRKARTKKEKAVDQKDVEEKADDVPFLKRSPPLPPWNNNPYYTHRSSGFGAWR